MIDRKEVLKTKLEESRTRLNAVLDQIGDRWEQQVYSDGLQWTVRQIVVHLADADRGHYNQVINIADGKDIIPEDFDIERYNKRTTEKRAEVTAEQARESLAESRALMLSWLQDLDPAKLDNTGRHASLNIMTVHDIVRLTALHEQDHANDIAKALDITI